MSKKALILVFISSIIISFALYANTIRGEFVYDDLFFVRRSELREPSSLIKVWQEPYLPQNQTAVAYRPLPVFTFSLNYILFGESPISFHIFNIILNGIVTFLFFLVVFNLFKNKILALFSSTFYAFLPIHTEAVAFIKARDDILATLFSLLAWFIFIKAARNDKVSARGVLFASVMWVVAVMGKEIAIVMPAVFILVFWIQNNANLKKLIQTSLLFIPATVSYFLVRFLILKEQLFSPDFVYFLFDPLRSADTMTRIWTGFKIAYIYISKIFVPIDLSATYTYNHLKLVSGPFDSWQTLTGVLLLAILVALILNRKTRNTLGIGAILFIIPYLMLSKFFVQVSEIASEKWMYLPSLGLSLIAGFVFYRIFQYKKWLGVTSLIFVLILYTPVLIQRNTVWASKESLFKSMVLDAPDSAFAHFALAQVYYEQHKYKESKSELAKALKIYQDYAPFMNLAYQLALKEGQGDVAAQAFRKTIELKPNELPALILTKQGMYQESLDLIKTFDPRIKKRPDVIFITAVNYYKLGMKEEAEKYFNWDISKSYAEKIKEIENF